MKQNNGTAAAEITGPLPVLSEGQAAGLPAEIARTCVRARNVLRQKGWPRAGASITYAANHWRANWYVILDRDDTSMKSGLLSEGYESVSDALVALASAALQADAAWSLETVGKTLGIIAEPAGHLLAAE